MDCDETSHCGGGERGAIETVARGISARGKCHFHVSHHTTTQDEVLLDVGIQWGSAAVVRASATVGAKMLPFDVKIPVQLKNIAVLIPPVLVLFLL